MTPTPEDIRLAEELTECWWLNKEKAQAIIAAHTAPLRERIKGLEERFSERIDKYMNERVCCSGHDCGCMGITRLEQFVGEEITLRDADLRELAEIGRLAVELARAAQGLDFDACSAKGEELGKASAAYLAKQESKP